MLSFCWRIWRFFFVISLFNSALGFKSQGQWGIAIAIFTISVTIGPYVLGSEFTVVMAPLMMAFTAAPVYIILKDASRNKYVWIIQ